MVGPPLSKVQLAGTAVLSKVEAVIESETVHPEASVIVTVRVCPCWAKVRLVVAPLLQRIVGAVASGIARTQHD